MNESIMEWVPLEIMRLCTIFGVSSDWDISIITSDTPGGSLQWDAAVSTDSEYLQATLEVKPDIKHTPENIQLLAHEVVHIVLSENRAVFIRALNSLQGPRGAKDELLIRWEYTENRTVQRLTRGVIKAIDTSS